MAADVEFPLKHPAGIASRVQRPGDETAAYIEELQRTIAQLRNDAAAFTEAGCPKAEGCSSKTIYLRKAIHDLRQPLQMLSLLHEVLEDGNNRAVDPVFIRRFGTSVTAALDGIARLSDILIQEEEHPEQLKCAAGNACAPRENLLSQSIGSAGKLDFSGQELPSVFVVDDDPIILETMHNILERVGYQAEVFTSGPAFFAACPADRKGCVLVDAFMPGMDGFELLQRLKTDGYALSAIMITGAGNVPMAVRAMKAGATDFIEKPFKVYELMDCLQRTLEPAVLEPAKTSPGTQFKALTDRQRQILELVLAGKPNKSIAYRLGLSQRTVESHRAAIMKKAGATSVAALVRWAMTSG
jgi:two-component system, chemotaxis family, CheB/CheR fusion protein